MDGSPKTPKSIKSTPRGAIDVLAAQCGKCFKWRVIPTPEEYEDIRSKFEEQLFFCDSKPDVSCDDPADIDYDSSRTWVIDKPNIPLTPPGFGQSTPRGAIDVLAAQCGKCFKWRVIPTREEYENIRSKFEEEPFFCDSKPDVSCDDPADIDYDSSRTWVIDKPNIPMTPPGFGQSTPRGAIDVLAAQCRKCFKWRVIPTPEEYEDIRSKFEEEPFFCDSKPDVSCDDPADIDYDSSRTWVIDKPNIPMTPPGFGQSTPRGAIDVLAAQCRKCFKWRVIPTPEEYEDIRSKFEEEPFFCDSKPDVSCDDPADIDYDSSRTWVIDKPNIPMTPPGFGQSTPRGAIVVLAAQCGKCFKWRVIPTPEEYEDIRSKFEEEPFFCDSKPDVSCDDPADIDYDSSRTWVIDKPNIPMTPPGFGQSTPRGAIVVLAAQCGKCFKWRVIPTPEEYEDIRSKFEEEPFFCDSKPDVSCDDPADIDYDSSRTWVIDKPNIPMTPPGFKRILVLKRDYSKLDTHYITPEEKKVRSRTEAGSYLQANPKYKDLSISDFVFTPPKVMEDTIPVDSLKRVAKKTKTSTEIKAEIE